MERVLLSLYLKFFILIVVVVNDVGFVFFGWNFVVVYSVVFGNSLVLNFGFTIFGRVISGRFRSFLGFVYFFICKIEK